jgi:hypothetical protein
MQLPSLASREFPFQPWIVFHSEFPRLYCDNGSAAFPKAARQSRCGSQSRDVLRKKKPGGVNRRFFSLLVFRDSGRLSPGSFT